MVHSVVIRTGARLHFGPLSFLPERGRHFGGIGMMIDEPGFEVQASFNLRGLVTDTAGPAEMPVLRRWRGTSRHGEMPPVRLHVEQGIPRHQGLGSGTQLALAIAEGLERLAGECDVEVPRLALQVGRGKRSAIGVYGYEQGGFIVDAGHRRNGGDLGALAARLDVPSQWRVVLIAPRDLEEGVAGADELRRFDQLPPMALETTGSLCRLAVTEMLPALKAHDHQAFVAALGEYTQRVGEFFSPVQGGIYRSPIVAEIAKRLPDQSPVTLAQSSWGPTAAAICQSEQTACELIERLRTLPESARIVVRQVRPLNRGRECRTRSS